MSRSKPIADSRGDYTGNIRQVWPSVHLTLKNNTQERLPTDYSSILFSQAFNHGGFLIHTPTEQIPQRKSLYGLSRLATSLGVYELNVDS